MRQLKWDKECVHKRLASEARTTKFNKAYQQLRAQYPELLPYGSPELFIGTLHAASGDYAEKDRILYAVISAAQNEPELRQCSFSLLSLAMWPALEHSYYKLLHLSCHLSNLFAEIHEHFLDELLRWNPSKRSRLAANLQLNVEKRIRQAVKKEVLYQANTRAYTCLSMDFDEVSDDSDMESRTDNNVERNESPTETMKYRAYFKIWRDGIPDNAMKRCLRSAKKIKPHVIGEPDRKILGEAILQLVHEGVISAAESRLIAEHVLHGIELKEIARRTGAQSNTVRARYFRLKAKLQSYHEDKKGA